MLKVAYSKIYNYPLPENHRFPMDKYDLIPKKLIAEKTLSKDNFFEPGILNKEDVLLTHSNDYYNKLVSQSYLQLNPFQLFFPIPHYLQLHQGCHQLFEMPSLFLLHRHLML